MFYHYRGWSKLELSIPLINCWIACIYAVVTFTLLAAQPGDCAASAVDQIHGEYLPAFLRIAPLTAGYHADD
jgi:hypothetical protein